MLNLLVTGLGNLMDRWTQQIVTLKVGKIKSIKRVKILVNDANYRYAHVPTLELTFLAENLLQNERYLEQSRQFDICIIDATYLMRLAWIQGQNYYLPSAYDRLQMARLNLSRKYYKNCNIVLAKKMLANQFGTHAYQF
jgi:hypothetical protein